MYINNSTFDNNCAYSNDDFESEGGAIFIEGLLSIGYDFKAYNSFFTNNFALYRGGAI